MNYQARCKENPSDDGRQDIPALALIITPSRIRIVPETLFVADAILADIVAEASKNSPEMGQ